MPSTAPMPTTPVPPQPTDTGALPTDAGILPTPSGMQPPASEFGMPPLVDGSPASPTSDGVPPSPADGTTALTDAPFDPAAAQADLNAGLDQLKQKEAQGASNKALSESKLNDMKKQIIMELFDLMKKAGVDPTDQKSISDFLNGLQQQSPDLYELFDFAFNNLTGQEPTATTTPDMMSSNPMGASPDMSGGTPPGGAPPTGPADLSNLTAAMGSGAGAPPAGGPSSPTGPSNMPNLTAAMGQ